MLLSGSEPAGNDSIPESSRGIVDLSPTAYLVAICRQTTSDGQVVSQLLRGSV
jgi:hypothetical protein